MTSDQEINDLYAELLARDVSLSPEQRRIERAQRRGDALLRSLARFSSSLNKNLPTVLLAKEVRLLYRRACSLWPEEMSKVLHDEFITHIRRRSARCLMCGIDLPVPVGESGYCAECEAECDTLITDCEEPIR